MQKDCDENHMEISWGARLPNRKTKALVNCRDSEGVAMCKANDSNEGIDKSTLILGQEKSRKHC